MTHPYVISNIYIKWKLRMFFHYNSYKVDNNYFFSIMLNLPKWPWDKCLTHFQVLSNVCVKYNIRIIIHKKDMSLARICYFPSSVLKPIWPWSKLWHILKSYTILVWRIKDFVRFGQISAPNFNAVNKMYRKSKFRSSLKSMVSNTPFTYCKEAW